MPSSSPSSNRGDRWVWAQFALMALALVLGLLPPGWPDWLRLLGIPVALGGVALGVWAGRTLGPSMTAFPKPRDDGVLVEDGPYAYVRHPIYTGGFLFFLGYGLVTSIPATAAAVALAVLWHFKAGVEERHLATRFAGWEDYRRRVRRGP